METPIRTYVVRMSGTIGTKATETRKRFNRRLEHNIERALDAEGVDYQMSNDWNRIFVETDASVGGTLRRVFGVQGVKPSFGIGWESLDDIVREGRRRYADRVDGSTFGVFSRRVGQRDRFPFDSVDVDRELGTALDERGGEVDLDDPAVAIRLEVHPERAFFFDDELEGPGGLPIGTEGRALALVSGGFDSVVAAWKMMRRGVELDFVFFNLAGRSHTDGLRRVLRELSSRWLWGYEPEIQLVDFRPLLPELRRDVADQYWQVVLKRMMYEGAAMIADDREVSGLVTGEAIGQVSSQTLPNLDAIEAGIDARIFRPLVGENKEDIIETARRIGVHDAAEQVPEFCGLAGGRPVTNTTRERVHHHRSNLDDELLETVVDASRSRPLTAFLDADGPTDPIQIERVPEEAALLDLRSEQDYENWHPPDAMHVPFGTAVEQHQLLPRGPTWVLYCEVGLKSAHVAERMRAAGFDAYSFRGGVPNLRRWFAERPTSPSDTGE